MTEGVSLHLTKVKGQILGKIEASDQIPKPKQNLEFFFILLSPRKLKKKIGKQVGTI